MSGDRRSAGRPSLREWLEFLLWAGLGAAVAFASISLVFAVPVVIVGVLLLVARHSLARAAFGFLLGIGAMSLFVAYVQRRGPGTVYWHTATASGADTYLDPRPWLVAGILLVAAGFFLFVRARRRPPHPTRAARRA